MSLVTISVVKAELGITDTSQDTLLTRYIDIISAKIEKLVGRIFASTVYSEKYTGNNSTKLVLKNYPIISVSDVLVNDDSIDDFEIAEASAGVLYRENLWHIKAYENPINMVPNGIDVRKASNIQVDYTAGFVTIPLDIQDICTQEVVRRYNKTYNTGNRKSWKLDDASETFDISSDLSSGLLAENANYLLANYKDTVV